MDATKADESESSHGGRPYSPSDVMTYNDFSSDDAVSDAQIECGPIAKTSSSSSDSSDDSTSSYEYHWEEATPIQPPCHVYPKEDEKIDSEIDWVRASARSQNLKSIWGERTTDKAGYIIEKSDMKKRSSDYSASPSLPHMKATQITGELNRVTASNRITLGGEDGEKDESIHKENLEEEVTNGIRIKRNNISNDSKSRQSGHISTQDETVASTSVAASGNSNIRIVWNTPKISTTISASSVFTDYTDNTSDTDAEAAKITGKTCKPKPDTGTSQSPSLPSASPSLKQPRTVVINGPCQESNGSVKPNSELSDTESCVSKILQQHINSSTSKQLSGGTESSADCQNESNHPHKSSEGRTFSSSTGANESDDSDRNHEKKNRRECEDPAKVKGVALLPPSFSSGRRKKGASSTVSKKAEDKTPSSYGAIEKKERRRSNRSPKTERYRSRRRRFTERNAENSRVRTSVRPKITKPSLRGKNANDSSRSMASDKSLFDRNSFKHSVDVAISSEDTLKYGSTNEEWRSVEGKKKHSHITNYSKLRYIYDPTIYSPISSDDADFGFSDSCDEAAYRTKTRKVLLRRSVQGRLQNSDDKREWRQESTHNVVAPYLRCPITRVDDGKEDNNNMNVTGRHFLCNPTNPRMNANIENLVVSIRSQCNRDVSVVENRLQLAFEDVTTRRSPERRRSKRQRVRTRRRSHSPSMISVFPLSLRRRGSAKRRQSLSPARTKHSRENGTAGRDAIRISTKLFRRHERDSTYSWFHNQSDNERFSDEVGSRLASTHNSEMRYSSVQGSRINYNQDVAPCNVDADSVFHDKYRETYSIRRSAFSEARSVLTEPGHNRIPERKERDRLDSTGLAAVTYELLSTNDTNMENGEVVIFKRNPLGECWPFFLQKSDAYMSSEDESCDEEGCFMIGKLITSLRNSNSHKTVGINTQRICSRYSFSPVKVPSKGKVPSAASVQMNTEHSSNFSKTPDHKLLSDVNQHRSDVKATVPVQSQTEAGDTSDFANTNVINQTLTDVTSDERSYEFAANCATNSGDLLQAEKYRERTCDILNIEATDDIIEETGFEVVATEATYPAQYEDTASISNAAVILSLESDCTSCENAEVSNAFLPANDAKIDDRSQLSSVVEAVASPCAYEEVAIASHSTFDKANLGLSHASALEETPIQCDGIVSKTEIRLQLDNVYQHTSEETTSVTSEVKTSNNYEVDLNQDGMCLGGTVTGEDEKCSRTTPKTYWNRSSGVKGWKKKLLEKAQNSAKSYVETLSYPILNVATTTSDPRNAPICLHGAVNSSEDDEIVNIEHIDVASTPLYMKPETSSVIPESLVLQKQFPAKTLNANVNTACPTSDPRSESTSQQNAANVSKDDESVNADHVDVLAIPISAKSNISSEISDASLMMCELQNPPNSCHSDIDSPKDRNENDTNIDEPLIVSSKCDGSHPGMARHTDTFDSVDYENGREDISKAGFVTYGLLASESEDEVSATSVTAITSEFESENITTDRPHSAPDYLVTSTSSPYPTAEQILPVNGESLPRPASELNNITPKVSSSPSEDTAMSNIVPSSDHLTQKGGEMPHRLNEAMSQSTPENVVSGVAIPLTEGATVYENITSSSSELIQQKIEEIAPVYMDVAIKTVSQMVNPRTAASLEESVDTSTAYQSVSNQSEKTAGCDTKTSAKDAGLDTALSAEPADKEMVHFAISGTPGTLQGSCTADASRFSSSRIFVGSASSITIVNRPPVPVGLSNKSAFRGPSVILRSKQPKTIISKPWENFGKNPKASSPASLHGSVSYDQVTTSTSNSDPLLVVNKVTPAQHPTTIASDRNNPSEKTLKPSKSILLNRNDSFPFPNNIVTTPITTTYDEAFTTSGPVSKVHLISARKFAPQCKKRKAEGSSDNARESVIKSRRVARKSQALPSTDVEIVVDESREEIRNGEFADGDEVIDSLLPLIKTKKPRGKKKGSGRSRWRKKRRDRLPSISSDEDIIEELSASAPSETKSHTQAENKLSMTDDDDDSDDGLVSFMGIIRSSDSVLPIVPIIKQEVESDEAEDEVNIISDSDSCGLEPEETEDNELLSDIAVQSTNDKSVADADGVGNIFAKFSKEMQEMNEAQLICDENDTAASGDHDETALNQSHIHNELSYFPNLTEPSNCGETSEIASSSTAFNEEAINSELNSGEPSERSNKVPNLHIPKCSSTYYSGSSSVPPTVNNISPNILTPPTSPPNDDSKRCEVSRNEPSNPRLRQEEKSFKDDFAKSMQETETISLDNSKNDEPTIITASNNPVEKINAKSKKISTATNLIAAAAEMAGVTTSISTGLVTTDGNIAADPSLTYARDAIGNKRGDSNIQDSVETLSTSIMPAGRHCHGFLEICLYGFDNPDKFTYALRRIPYVQTKRYSVENASIPGGEDHRGLSGGDSSTVTTYLRLRDVICLLKIDVRSLQSLANLCEVELFRPSNYTKDLFATVYDPVGISDPMIAKMTWRNALSERVQEFLDHMIILDKLLHSILPRFYAVILNIPTSDVPNFVNVKIFKPIFEINEEVVKIFRKPYEYNSVLIKKDHNIQSTRMNKLNLWGATQYTDHNQETESEEVKRLMQLRKNEHAALNENVGHNNVTAHHTAATLSPQYLGAALSNNRSSDRLRYPAIDGPQQIQNRPPMDTRNLRNHVHHCDVRTPMASTAAVDFNVGLRPNETAYGANMVQLTRVGILKSSEPAKYVRRTTSVHSFPATYSVPHTLSQFGMTVRPTHNIPGQPLVLVNPPSTVRPHVQTHGNIKTRIDYQHSEDQLMENTICSRTYSVNNTPEIGRQHTTESGVRPQIGPMLSGIDVLAEAAATLSAIDGDQIMLEQHTGRNSRSGYQARRSPNVLSTVRSTLQHDEENVQKPKRRKCQSTHATRKSARGSKSKSS